MSTAPLSPPPASPFVEQTTFVKPGQVTAIGILCLVSGILDCFGVLSLLALWPGGIYSLIIGILEIIYAAKILPEPMRTSKMGHTLAILQIINIINCSGLAVVTGILSLVFYNDPRVRGYFHEMARRGVPA